MLNIFLEMWQTILWKEKSCVTYEDPLHRGRKEAYLQHLWLPICENKILKKPSHNSQRCETVCLRGELKNIIRHEV